SSELCDEMIRRSADPDIGLEKASGINSGETPHFINIGEITPTKASSEPEIRKIDIPTIIPRYNGNNVKAISIPSLPPSTSNSYAGNFFLTAITNMINIKQGIIHVLIKVIYAKMPHPLEI